MGERIIEEKAEVCRWKGQRRRRVIMSTWEREKDGVGC